MEKDASSVRELYENDMYAAVQSEVAGMMLKYEDHIPAHLEMEMQSYYVFSGIRLKQTDIDALVADYRERIVAYEKPVVMLQGEFVFTYRLVKRLKEEGVLVLASCTDRKTVEKQEADGSTTKTSVFEFVGFRAY